MEGHPPRRRVRALLLATLILLAVPAFARADHFGNTPNWPELQPPNPGNSAQTIDPGFDACPEGEIQCPRDVIAEMYERWRPLNATCDHNAVFALTYLRTTEEYLRTVEHQPDFFSDLAWINHEDAVFAEFYFRAFDEYAGGGEVPEAWRLAFEAAESDDLTAVGDLLLGMNAHINRDLAYTLAAVGLVPPEGGSRKLDHDRVNFFLERVADPLQTELAERYDELFDTTDGSPSPFDEQAVLETVRGFRENAWRNAENLVNAPTPELRALAAQNIEQQAAAGAQTIIAQNTVPGYGAVRDAHCQTNLADAFRAKLNERRIHRVLHRGSLRYRVWTDGPATLRLRAKLLAPRGAAKPADRNLVRSRTRTLAAAGKHRGTLPLRRRGERLLADRGRAKVRLIVLAPGGLRAAATRVIRR